ncbi:ABC transporter permease [Escherichia coli]|nr:ABC transporter permease [Escherichia coli]MBA8147392.1 ABC transporter permease [Escherichia coli]
MQTITIAPPKRSWFSLLSWAVVLAVLVVSWQGAEMAPLTLIKDGGNMATFAADFFPPDFSQWQDYLTEMAVTLQIAVWGTALAVVLSIPFGLMSAENLVPWWVYQPVRRLMDACRAINEMVFAMLFVVVVGMVGAGGIGVTLWEAIRGFQFQQTCALMVLIIVTVSLLDFLSQRLRKHFI